MGAKLTPALIPLCHSLMLSKVSVDLTLDDAAHAVVIRAEAATVGSTGAKYVRNGVLSTHRPR